MKQTTRKWLQNQVNDIVLIEMGIAAHIVVKKQSSACKELVVKLIECLFC